MNRTETQVSAYSLTACEPDNWRRGGPTTTGSTTTRDAVPTRQTRMLARREKRHPPAERTNRLAGRSGGHPAAGTADSVQQLDPAPELDLSSIATCQVREPVCRHHKGTGPPGKNTRCSARARLAPGAPLPECSLQYALFSAKAENTPTYPSTRAAKCKCRKHSNTRSRPYDTRCSARVQKALQREPCTREYPTPPGVCRS
ncbi:hypothetical protein NDU88_005626 [Pleurodeles waltl]|uniref:Uncharacterized protein n=1 Tax=Pleurodeles waltl TaxID=8319 RepID=A0AAV7MBS7_PLEWA|nr:hypothetical protein NDU88_005626 [Pleurodeles waltl]